jgi:hypothetical protein
MSWQASAYVDSLTAGISRSEKLLLFVLADHHNPESGWAWPSISRLENRTMLKERWVYRLLRSLEGKGLIEIEHNGGQTTNRYRFPGMAPALNAPPGLQTRVPLYSGAKQTVNEPIEEEEAARSSEWLAMCNKAGVLSGVDHDGYWKKVKKVPEITPALTRLLRCLASYSDAMYLMPGSVGPLNYAATVLQGLNLDDASFRVTLPQIEVENPICLQKLAPGAVEWATGIRNSYGKVSI